MLQDIAPKHLNNHYRPELPLPDSKICIFRGNEILIARGEAGLRLPEYALIQNLVESCVYLFSIDAEMYFLADLKADAVPSGFSFEAVREHRKLKPKATVYAEMTAWHLYVWYRDNRFCGRCGKPTCHDGKLRMLSCPSCGNMIFPKICPAIIVAVTHGDQLLLTRYNARAVKSYALIAGFTEIGETAEETVMREVMEETGVRVKNIRFYGTQPWGVDCDLLLGYFADLDGAADITLDREELASAAWVQRGDIDAPYEDVSLTNDMICAFVDGRYPK